jgi:hypothetical protein
MANLLDKLSARCAPLASVPLQVEEFPKVPFETVFSTGIARTQRSSDSVKNSLVFVLFCAFSSGPSRRFIEELKTLLAKSKWKHRLLSVILVSTDTKYNDFQSLVALSASTTSGSWFALPFGMTRRVARLRAKLKVSSVPWLTVCTKEGHIVKNEADIDIRKYGDGALGIWEKAIVEITSKVQFNKHKKRLLREEKSRKKSEAEAIKRKKLLKKQQVKRNTARRQSMVPVSPRHVLSPPRHILSPSPRSKPGQTPVFDFVLPAASTSTTTTKRSSVSSTKHALQTVREGKQYLSMTEVHPIDEVDFDEDNDDDGELIHVEQVPTRYRQRQKPGVPVMKRPSNQANLKRRAASAEVTHVRTLLAQL